MGVGVVLAVLAPAGVVAALTTRTSSDSDDEVNRAEGTRPFAPERQSVADPFPSDPRSASRYPVAYLRGRTQLYDKPGGKPRLHVPRRPTGTPLASSAWCSARNWLAVLTPELRNGEVAWVRDDAVAKLAAVTYSIHADLSRRQVTVRRNGSNVRTFKVGVGRPEYRTPPGRYAVTDKLRVKAPGSPYGCCVLALTGHQTKLPPGWPGGDRLARARHQGPSGARASGQPRLHARRYRRRPLDDEEHPAWLAASS